VVDIGRVDRLHERVGVGEGGQQHPDRLGRDLPAPRQELGPRHPGHPLVADHERDGLGDEQIERRLGPLGAEHAVVHGEQRLERIEDPHLVVHDEDRRLAVT
jgi:hypothetical protein